MATHMTENIRPDPGFCTKTSCIQMGYGMWVSMTVVAIGLAFGFPAVTLPQLNDPSSSIQITTKDESWIASVLTLVAPAGSLICGYLMDKYGRRATLILCHVPICVGWMFTGFAGSAGDIIIGRIITGVGIGMAMGAPRIYITEISLPNMRGTIGALPNLALSVGLTMQAGFGAVLDWKTICYICGAYSLILFFVNMILPETPYYVLLKGTTENAQKTLQKFRSKTYQMNREMNEMIEYKAVNNIRRLTFREEICLLFTKAACKPFWIVLTYLLLSQISGVTIIFMWTIELIEASNSSVDANMGNILMGLSRFCFAFVSSLLLYRIGRKPQALISSIGVGVSFIILGAMIHILTEPSVIPMICFVAVVIFSTIGYYTIPLLVMYELYPLQVRGFLGGISVSLLNIFIFVVNILYPYVRNTIGHENLILSFGICSLLGSIFLYFYLPETKDLTLQEIEEYFNDRRSTLVSQRSVIAAQLSGTMRNINSATKSHRTSKDNKPDPNKDPNKDVLQLRKKKKNPEDASTSHDKNDKIENEDKK